jgi:hypothetical protein
MVVVLRWMLHVVVVGGVSYGVWGCGGRALQGASEDDGHLHPSGVVLVNNLLEQIFEAGDEGVDLVKLAGDADV